MIELRLGAYEDFQLAEEGGGVGELANNCVDIRRDIEERYDVAKFGSCSHPTALEADVYALTTLVRQVMADGGLIGVTAGHRTVRNNTGNVSWVTYLSYAAGHRNVGG